MFLAVLSDSLTELNKHKFNGEGFCVDLQVLHRAFSTAQCIITINAYANRYYANEITLSLENRRIAVSFQNH